MKRVGIVSRIHGVNYGANLQAVALQNVLQKLGAYAEYVNFEVKVPSPNYLKRILSCGYGIVRLFLGFRQRLQHTNEFRDSHLKLSLPIKDRRGLEECSLQYDILMAGSDQIWNPRYYSLSEGLYLLSFSKKCRKVSYASSFGVKSIPDCLKPIYKSALDGFDAISVRESEGACILNDLGLKNVQIHIDPTLLMNAEQWKLYFKTDPLIDEPYICCYVMSGANELNSYIITKAEELQKGLASHPRIVVLGEKEYKGLCSPHKYVRKAGPADFLNYIYNAQYVLTSSFHGTCFSVIFQKNFFSILSIENKFNSRIENLLRILALDNRIYYKENNKSLETNPCIYKTVMPKIDEQRHSAVEYLRNIVLK